VTTRGKTRPTGAAGVRNVDLVSAVDKVATEVRRAIVGGDMKPGSSFSLRDLAQQLGVSFIPLREALRRLEAQGLIVIRPGRSAMVAELDRDDLHAIYRLRKRIEPEIAGRSSELLDAEAVAELEHLLAVFGDDRTDNERQWELHREFHLKLLRPAMTPWDLRTLEMLWDAGERYVRHAFDKHAMEPQERRRRLESHHDLLRAVVSGDARAATLEHLERNEQTAISGITDDAA
jgi:DNA-binding GntR family transcriptional regulator